MHVCLSMGWYNYVDDYFISVKKIVFRFFWLVVQSVKVSLLFCDCPFPNQLKSEVKYYVEEEKQKQRCV